MIKSLRVSNLNGSINAELSFNDDMNILTGDNGSGKTSILKLLWYIISGNIERILPEMTFRELELTTTEYRLRASFDAEEIPSLTFEYEDGTGPLVKQKLSTARPSFSAFVNEFNKRVVGRIKSSVFFPTFRRIEGGFSTTAKARRFARFPRTLEYPPEDPFVGSLQSTLSELSSRLTVGEHRFVCAISTDDIVELITRKYAEISQRINQEFLNFSGSIVKSIGSYEPYAKTDVRESLEDATSILDGVRQQATEVERKRSDLLRPFSVLSDVVAHIYKSKGIGITGQIHLGAESMIVESAKLSSGEKQMLSFLAYNAFVTESPFFVDEPELSLHVDWQRQLFPVLMKQGSNNQFIVATHSPLIYSKYADKEITISAKSAE